MAMLGSRIGPMGFLMDLNYCRNENTHVEERQRMYMTERQTNNLNFAVEIHQLK